MADILKVTTALVNKDYVHNSKPAPETAALFNLQDVSKVAKTNPQRETLNQNTGLIPKDDAPTILMNLLKDPAVTINFLRNIYFLEETIGLLSMNNSPVTEEIQQMFNALLIQPEEIVAELMRQEHASTSFKGVFFDFLRGLLAGNPNAELRYSVAVLLKSINGMQSQTDILDSIANSLQFLSESMSSSTKLSAKLSELSLAFRDQSAVQNFSQLKSQLLSLVNEIQNSILYSPQIGKLVPLIVYNLSRFKNNPQYVQEAIGVLLTQIDGKDAKAQFLQMVGEYLVQMDGEQNPIHSHIMDTLAELIQRQAQDEQISLSTGDRIEKIIQSLLSSPCNFTPLLHFVIPVDFDGMKSFAELWIDPDAREEEASRGGDSKNIHMLIVFDVEGIGQFEVELRVHNQDIKLSLFCPRAYLEQFRAVSREFAKVTDGLDYRMEQITVEQLERTRSLMDVFKSLPYKRTGVDVKV